jgi:hypothetical protein
MNNPIFKLEPNTLCPFGKENKNGLKTIKPADQQAELSKRVSGGYEVCCSACRGRHTKNHFKGKDENAYAIFTNAFNYASKKNTKIIVNNTLVGNTILKKKPGRPPKPLDEDEHILHFNKTKERFLKVVDDLANCYQAEVDSKLKIDKPNKDDISPTFKNILWANKYGDIIKFAYCPVCNTNPIFSDNFSCGHIFPEVYGGKLTIDNVMPVCTGCNKLMTDKHLYAFAWLKFKRILFTL